MKERAPHTSRLVRACGANKNLFWILIPTPKSGYLVALYSTHVVRLVAPPHLTKHIREEVIPDLQHLLLHARLHLTLLVHLLNRSPHHPSPVAYSFSYIVVAYSASWSSYCSRASFHSSSLRPRRSSGSIQLTLVSMLIGFVLLHVGNQNRIRFSTWLYKWSTRFLIPRLHSFGLG